MSRLKKNEWLALDGFRTRGEFVSRPLRDHLKYGDVVITGTQNIDDAQYVGYCVQLREHAGWGFADSVWIRHPDGQVIQHENQCFWHLCEKDAQLVLDNSKTDPDDEGGDHIYTQSGKYEEMGFLIPYRSKNEFHNGLDREENRPQERAVEKSCEKK